MKFNIWLSWRSSVFIFTFFYVAFQNEQLPSRRCPSLTRSDALSPRWQHIYIVAMDTTSITLCMAFTDLQIKDASLTVVSGEPACVFHTPSRNTMIAACHTWQKTGATPTDTTIDGASMAWPVGAWHEVCVVDVLAQRCAILNGRTHSRSLLHLWIKLRPSGCLKWHLSNNWVVEKHDWSKRVCDTL